MVAEGATTVATLTATDSDTQTADLAWSIPAGTDGGSDRDKFSLTSAGALRLKSAKDYENPDDEDTDGVYELTVQVSDGGRTASADLTVTLSNVNEIPTANAGPDQENVAEGVTVTLSGTGSDPDAGEVLTYSWMQTAGTPTVTLSDTAVASPTFTAPTGLTADTTLTFMLRVADDEGSFSDDSVDITVKAAVEGLMVEVEEVPAWHDGSSTVTFQLYFSKEIDISYRDFSNGVFEMTGGTVQGARRLVKLSNVGWEITIQPDGRADVSIVLPANRACDATGAVCTSDGEQLSEGLDITIPGPDSPLKARVDGVPAEHDGISTVTFQLYFSKEIDISYRDFSNGVFQMTGGTVQGARRLVRLSNLGWEITVSPDSNGTVTIVLPVTTDCASDGAICTNDGRMLSNRLELTIRGP